MPLTKRDLGVGVQRLVCANGDTTAFVVPLNRTTKVTGLHVDTTHASGLTGNIRIQLLDTFASIGVATGQVNRFQTQVQAGDVGDIPLRWSIAIF